MKMTATGGNRTGRAEKEKNKIAPMSREAFCDLISEIRAFRYSVS